jgi:uncharacterized protein (TIGR02996 family)
MTQLDGLLQAIVDDPEAEDRWLILADWLDDHDDPLRAELLRLHLQLLATCCEPEQHPVRAEWQARVVQLLGQGVRPCVPQKTVPLGQGVEMRFSFIRPGTFLMGSPEDEEGRYDDEIRHQVTLTKGFWLGVYPVTQAQWRAAMWTPEMWSTVGEIRPWKTQRVDRPVQFVSWDNCQTLCRSLEERLAGEFRLPMEAEWEYACRAGTTTAYYTGNGVEALKRAGGCTDWRRPAEETKPVGQFQPNAWGLYDMHGNVREWCQDLYGGYPNRAVTNPQGPTTGFEHVGRGGSSRAFPRHCRSAYRNEPRNSYPPAGRGCRVCRILD